MRARDKVRPPRAGVEAPGKLFRHFGLCLRTFRVLSGHTGGEIARRANITASQFSKFELGRELPRLSTFERILMSLELSPLTFFNGLAALERGFVRREGQDGVEPEVPCQPGSTGSILEAQEGQALFALYEMFLHQVEEAIEGGLLSLLPRDQEPRS
jgi:transcriptional regulator with XRE-family HTH domain